MNMGRKKQNPYNFFPASLDQKSKIAHAITTNNELRSETIESVISFLIAISVSKLGMSLIVSSHYFDTYLKKIIFSISNDVAQLNLPWLHARYRTLYTNDQPLENIYQDALVMYENLLRANEQGQFSIQPYHIHPNSGNILINNLRLLLGTNNINLLVTFSNLILAANAEGAFRLQITIITGLVLLTPIIRKFPINFVLQRMLHKFYDLRYIGEKPFALMSYNEAKDFLIDLKKENKFLKKMAYYGKAFNIGITLLVLLYAVASFNNYIIIEPDYWIFIFSNIITITGNIYSDIKKQRAESQIIQNLKASQKSFNKALSDTDGYYGYGHCKISLGSKATDCYITFKAKEYAALSANLVNQIVKDILLKHGIKIIEYSSTCHTFKVQTLNATEILSIKNMIKSYLDRHLEIKTLSMQLRFYFPEDIFKNIYIEDGLPTASFQINYLLNDNQFAIFANCFDTCSVARDTNGVLFLKGHASTSSEKIKTAIATRDHFISASANTTPQSFKIKKVSNRKSDPVESSTPPEDKPAPTLVEYHWKSGHYSNQDPSCPVKPLTHQVFGRNHFILFAIPSDYFPPNGSYEKIREKINEGRLAKNAIGQQELQFREEGARDLTRPGQPPIVSFLRYKTLGDLGDMRVYSRREINNEGMVLDIFCGLDPTSHKKR
jgi:hypothetical protein